MAWLHGRHSLKKPFRGVLMSTRRKKDKNKYTFQELEEKYEEILAFHQELRGRYAKLHRIITLHSALGKRKEIPKITLLSFKRVKSSLKVMETHINAIKLEFDNLKRQKEEQAMGGSLLEIAAEASRSLIEHANMIEEQRKQIEEIQREFESDDAIRGLYDDLDELLAEELPGSELLEELEELPTISMMPTETMEPTTTLSPPSTTTSTPSMTRRAMEVQSAPEERQPMSIPSSTPPITSPNHVTDAVTTTPSPTPTVSSSDLSTSFPSTPRSFPPEPKPPSPLTTRHAKATTADTLDKFPSWGTSFPSLNEIYHQLFTEFMKGEF